MNSLGFIAGLAIGLSAIWFCLVGNVDLGLLDEGYLWHNIQRTFEGSIPIRDFRAYEPGRYYWGALFFQILGPGFQSLRFSMHIFQMIGLFFGLLLLQKIISRKAGLILAGLLLLLLIYPRYKICEHTLIIMAVFFACGIIEKPSLRRHFGTGVFIGLSAWFGKNLGIYFSLSFLGLILYHGFFERHPNLLRRYAVLILGIITGYLPMIAMIVFIHGFQAAYFDSILRIFGPFAPVKNLPVPWPWQIDLMTHNLKIIFYPLLLGFAFLGIYVFYISSIGVIAFSKRKILDRSPLYIASVFIGFPLMHHITGRADFYHLAEGLFPVIIGILAFAKLNIRIRVTKPILAIILIGIFTLYIHSSTDISMATRRIGTAFGNNKSLVKVQLPGGYFWLDQKQTHYIEQIKQFKKTHVNENETILIAPYEAGLYPILQQNAPIWDPFPIHKATLEEELESIRDIEKNHTHWAILSNWPLDGIPERHFSQTHPMLWHYLMTHYEPIASPDPSINRIFLQAKMREQ